DVNLYIDLVAKSGEMFVDRIVENFEHHVVQTALVRIADIHPGPFPDCLQAFELVDLRGVVFLQFVDVGELALTISFDRFFVVWIDGDGGSSWHRKKLAKTPQKTTNNLVLPRDLFPLQVGGWGGQSPRYCGRPPQLIHSLFCPSCPPPLCPQNLPPPFPSKPLPKPAGILRFYFF